MAIKCLMFDWGGVCAKGKLGHVLGKQLAKKMKRPHKSITKAYLKSCWEYQKGKLTSEQFWKKVQKELDTKIRHEELERCHVTARELNRGVVELVKKLKKRYKVVLVTNTYKEYYEHNNRRHGIDRMFDDVILSYKVKGRKPEPKIYTQALRTAGCKAAETVFIEDKEAHLAPARKMGMKTILYKNQEDLKKRLKRLGVQW
ncbi:TPA: HAD family phosphatase [Candidatus Woesearchaeota archaeon]|nr:HAD family phosphatase [Candidatus Woesearchaeota archaeon]